MRVNPSSIFVESCTICLRVVYCERASCVIAVAALARGPYDATGGVEGLVKVANAACMRSDLVGRLGIDAL